MSPIVVRGIDELRALVGKTLGPGEWRTVTQEDVDAFARLTGDKQWIHVDVERAKRESPYGTTIAHGNLTLSMIDGFRDGLFTREGFALGVNYGWNKVRFPAPVPVGSRLRAKLELVSVEDVGGGWHQIIQRWTVEREGETKPVCVADSVGRVLVT
jgi:acyl dehydratase